MQTKYRSTFKLFLSSCAVLVAASSSQASECANLGPSTKEELIRLARFRYKIDESVPLHVEGELLQDCFIRARVFSSNSGQNFLKVFTVMPDQRYTVSELTDLRQNPEDVAQRAHNEFVRQLVADGAPIRGDSGAPVTIVIFSDFQCPFCKRAADLLNAELASSETRAKLVFRQFPLPNHDWALPAAEASACAARQQRNLFWIAHDFLFQHQRELSQSNVVDALEKELRNTPGFDTTAFRQCVGSGSSKAAINADIAFGLENNVHATPTVFVNGRKVIWAGNPDQLKSLVLQASKSADN